MAPIPGDVAIAVVIAAASVVAIIVEWKDKKYLKRLVVGLGILNALTVWSMLTPNATEENYILFGRIIGGSLIFIALAVHELHTRRSKKEPDHEPQWHYG